MQGYATNGAPSLMQSFLPQYQQPTYPMQPMMQSGYPAMPMQPQQMGYPYANGMPNIMPMAQMNPMVMNQPMINNFPVQGQPINQTQTGIPYDQLRNEIATVIASRQNEDVAMMALAQESCGANQNWLTGRMDKLVNTCGMTIDVMFRMTPGMDINKVRNDAVNEVVNCAWAQKLIDNPAWQHDETVKPRLGLFQTFSNLLQQRGQQFINLGLNQNFAPQNVNPYSTPSAMNPMMRMGVPMNGMIMGQQQQGVSTMGNSVQNNYAMANPNVRQNLANPERKGGGVLSMHEIANKAKEARQKAIEEGVPLDRYGNPDYRAMKQGYNNRVAQNVNNVSEVNHVPETRNTFANLPNTQQSQPVKVAPPKPVEAPMTATPMTEAQNRALAEQWAAEFDRVKQQQANAKVAPYSVSFTEDNQEQVAQLFNEVKHDYAQETSNTHLLDDEVKVLTRAEVKTLMESGVRFETPYAYLLSGNPNQIYLHVVLTANNELRQIVTQVEESKNMRLDKHLCILDGIRNDPRVKQDPNAKKTIDENFLTSRGGVIFDRFKQAAVVLNEEIRKVSKDMTEEERTKQINEAFTKFNEQVAQDEKEYHNGVYAYKYDNREENEDRDPVEIQDEIDMLFTDKMLEAIAEESNSTLKVQLDDEVYSATNANNTLSEMRLRAISEGKKMPEDLVSVSVHRDTGVYHVFNDAQETHAVKTLLNCLFWDKELPANSDNSKTSITKVVASLKNIRDQIPTTLFQRIDNYATKLVNTMLPTIGGLDCELDSFIDDWDNFVKQINDNGLFDKKPNLDIGLRTMSTFILANLQQFFDTEEIVENIGEVDMVKERALTYERYGFTVNVPELALSLGLTDKENTLTMVSNNDLYNLLTKLTSMLLTTRVRREQFDHPLMYIDVVTAEGNAYRVYPRMGDASYDSSNRNDFYPAFTLIRHEVL